MEELLKLHKKLIELSYPEFYRIKEDSKYNAEDLESYVEFCDAGGDKTLGTWLKYQSIKQKIAKKGIASVLFNKSLLDVRRSNKRCDEHISNLVVPTIKLFFPGMPVITITGNPFYIN